MASIVHYFFVNEKKKIIIIIYANQVLRYLVAVFVKYLSPPSSGTIYVSFEIGRLVPELGGLGYFVKYSSPPSSGTKLDIL